MPIDVKPFIKGGGDFGAKSLRSELKNVLERHAKKSKQALERPTQTWEHDVDAKIRAPGSMEREITVEDEAYLFVNEGTQAHEIEGDPLAYQNSFKAKTVVGSLSARPGGKYGDWVHPTSVMHPGFDARHFDDLTLKEVEPGFARDIDAAIDRSVS